MSSLSDQLESLLAESPAVAELRARSAFATLAGPHADTVILVGAGNLGRATLAKLRQANRLPLAFADNNPARWNTTLDGLAVLSPADAAAQFGSSATFIITIWNAGQTHRTRDLAKQFTALGCRAVIPFAFLYWQHPELFLPYFAIDLPHHVLRDAPAVRQAFALLADEPSRQEFLAQLRFRLFLDFDSLPDPSPDVQYFPTDLPAFNPGSHFVDCGAFDGDTLAHLAQHPRTFRHVTAFEPDPANFAKLQALAASLVNAPFQLTLHQAAVSDRAGTHTFAAAGTGASRIAATGITVPAVRLDDALTGPPPTYIKMDIEGAEPDALRGSAALIARHRPALAICAYHLQAHLWQIPLLIHTLAPTWRLYLRPHNREAFDLICYALPVSL